MKIVVFGDERRVGALVGDRVLDLARSNPALPAGLRQFVEAGQQALEGAQRAIDAIDRAPDGAVVALKDVRLHAPWPERRIACVGGNFADHLRGMERGEPKTIEQVTQQARAAGQWGFWKVPAFVSGPDDDVAYPKRTEYFDYEGEVALVIGKRGKDIAADRLDEYVWGVTLFNDLSIRDGMGSPRPMSYNLAKNFDGSTCMGPCIVVGEVAPAARRRGDVRQRRGPPALQHARHGLFVRGGAGVPVARLHVRARGRDRGRHGGGDRRGQDRARCGRLTTEGPVSQSRRRGDGVVAAGGHARPTASSRLMSAAYERFREICLSLPETSEVFVENWGHPTFRVGPERQDVRLVQRARR